MDFFITLVVVVVTEIYTYVQAHRNVHINYVQAFRFFWFFLDTSYTSRVKWKFLKKHKKRKWKEVSMDKGEDIRQQRI